MYSKGKKWKADVWNGEVSPPFFGPFIALETITRPQAVCRDFGVLNGIGLPSKDEFKSREGVKRAAPDDGSTLQLGL